MKKYLIAFSLFVASNTYADVMVPSNECLNIVKAEVLKKLESTESFGTPCKCGINKIKPNFTKINSGGVYIHYAFADKSLNWKVVTVVNKNCEIMSVNIPELK